MAVEKQPKPIILMTHPRACSTAFERIFLTRAKDVVCVHEPLTGAFYFGPERLSDRYTYTAKQIAEKGYEEYTYSRALEIIEEAGADGKRILVKDFAKCIIPPDERPSAIAPSLRHSASEVTENGGYMKLPETDQFNPTIIPSQVLRKFHFAFLIRSPRLSIPSLYKCSVPPKSALTGWHGFRSKDAGYRELRILFDYLKSTGNIGRSNAGAKETFTAEPDDICIVDADDLLEDPERVIKAFCVSVGIPFEPSMLFWDKAEDRQRAEALFEEWAPFHDIAIQSTSIISRPPINDLDPTVEYAEWARMFGEEEAETIRRSVQANLDDYLYLKKFKI